MENYFSIFKLDNDLIWEDILKKNKDDFNTSEMIQDLTCLIKKKLIDSNYLESNIFIKTKDSDVLIAFSKEDEPRWKHMVKDHFELEPEVSRFISSKSSSFIMMSQIGGSVFATTGGYGSNYLRYFIIKNFGLSMLTKIFSESSSVIQELSESRMLGDRVAMSAINRDSTQFLQEKEYTNILKRVIASGNLEIAIILGIPFEEKEKSFNLISTDALRISKLLTLNEYKVILENVSELYERESNFPMNYFVPISNAKLTKAHVFEVYCEKIINGSVSMRDIKIIGDNHWDYLESTHFEVINDKEELVISSSTPIKMAEVYKMFETKNKTNISSLTRLFKKWKIKYGKKGAHLDEFFLIDIVDLYFESDFEIVPDKSYEIDTITKEYTIYLSAGDWYYLDGTYLDFLIKEYEVFSTKGSDVIEDIFVNNKLVGKFENEVDYNKSFFNKQDGRKQSKNLVRHLFNGDRILVSNIEICDLLLYYNEKIYLLCNKYNGSGAGCRDLLGQVVSAAHLIAKSKDHLTEYYDKLCNGNENFKSLFDFNTFSNKMKNATFISVYVKEGYLPTSKSNYIKILSLQTEKELRELGFDFYTSSPMNYI